MAEKKSAAKAEKKSAVKEENVKESAQVLKEPPLAEKTAVLKETSTDILKFVLMTEKAVQLIESQNKLVFVVDRHANKNDIKKAAESMFSSRVNYVTTVIDQSGRKRAFIKFAKEGEAGEIAIRLGII